MGTITVDESNNFLNKVVKNGATILFPEFLFVGQNNEWNTNCWFNAGGKIYIGKDVCLGPYCIIHSGCHKFDRTDIPIREQGYTRETVYIEDDCWLGARVTVLAGVRIGQGSVIGAGAVVTKSIPDFSVAVGVPAKVIRSRLKK